MKGLAVVLQAVGVAVLASAAYGWLGERDERIRAEERARIEKADRETLRRIQDEAEFKAAARKAPRKQETKR